MSGFLLIACRAGMVILSFVLSVLVIKTFEHFEYLPDTHRAKPVLAWDMLALFAMLVFLLAQLVAR